MPTEIGLRAPGALGRVAAPLPSPYLCIFPRPLTWLTAKLPKTTPNCEPSMKNIQPGARGREVQLLSGKLGRDGGGGGGSRNHSLPHPGRAGLFFSILKCILGFSWLGIGPMPVALLRDGGFWKRFPVLVQPLGGGGSASLRIWPPGNKHRDAPNQQDSFHWLGPAFNQGNTEVSPSIARFLF